MNEPYEITIEVVTLTPLVVHGSSAAEALKKAVRLIQRDLSEAPEAIGDPVTQPPRIRSVRKLGE